MEPKPDHWGPECGAQFADPSVVAAYRCRPAYPPGTFDVLRELALDEGLPVLDVGCGRGDLTGGLASFASRVDAVDPSPGMLEEARAIHAGQDANIRWIQDGIPAHSGSEEASAVPGPPDRPPTAAEVARAVSWAKLLRKVFEVDPLRCPRCGGSMAVVAWITDPATVDRILAHRRRRGTRSPFEGAEARAPPAA